MPLEMLKVVGAALNYTVAARALGAGGLSYLAAEMVGNGAAVVRGPGDPLWAALQAGLAVDAPELFVDDVGSNCHGYCVASLINGVNAYQCKCSGANCCGDTWAYGTCP